MAKKKKVFKYPEEYYLPERLKEGILPVEYQWREFERLAKEANARLEKFKGTRFESSQAYKKNAGKFTVDNIDSETDLRFALYDVSKFLRSEGSTVKGQRAIERRAIDTAHERGMDFLNEKNLQSFGNFMEEARQRNLVKLYGSERVMELYSTISRKGFNPDDTFEDFEFWIESQEELEAMPKIRSVKDRTSENYRQRLENW